MENQPQSFNTKEELQAFMRKGYQEVRKLFLPDLLDALKREDWKEFINIALSKYQVMPDAFFFYDKVPDELKYNFAIEAYGNHGDSIPAVRKAVRSARKYGAPTLPDEIAKQEVITIYRAGEEPPRLAPYRISWTTDFDIALFFLEKWQGRHANYLYQGKIKTADIIAYTDDRNEAEVMQYRKVFDIEVLREGRT